MGDLDVTLLTDPYENEASLRFPRTVAPDILLLSHQDRSRFNLEGVQGTPFLISNPGEYEVKGAHVHAFQDKSVEAGEKYRPLISRIVVEGMSLAFLGQLKRKLTAEELEQLESIDILLLPVGGGDVMDAKLASEAIAEIEPRMVVPLYYDIPGIKTQLANVDTFCKNVGVCDRQDMPKLKISKKDLPSDTLVVSVLERA